MPCLPPRHEVERGAAHGRGTVLENNPLVGTFLLDGCHLDVEMAEGGEVVIELPA